METLSIPNENDLKRWIKEAVKDFLQEFKKTELKDEQNEKDLLNRKEIATFLRVSLPTLTDWIKRGLPSHKQRGRVYFDKTEVIQNIKENKMGQFKFGTRLQQLRKEIYHYHTLVLLISRKMFANKISNSVLVLCL